VSLVKLVDAYGKDIHLNPQHVQWVRGQGEGKSEVSCINGQPITVQGVPDIIVNTLNNALLR